MPDAMRRAMRGVLADIDDTLTTHGRLTATAYAALERLRAAGKLVIPITGRPAGWCDHIARMWPVDAVVGENGAFYMRYDDRARAGSARFVADDATRARESRAARRRSAQRILAAVPGCALASDQLYREADLAIDFREDVPPLPRAAVDRIVALMEAEGHDRPGELDPRQRLVRRVRQAVDDPDADGRSVRHRPRPRARSASCSPAIRRTTRRCSRSFRMRWGWPTSAISPIASPRCRRTSPQAEAGAGFAELAEFLLA